MNKRMSLVGACLFWLAVVNFAVYFVISVQIGGDAVRGTFEAGRYYLSAHGRLTEVPRWVWLYSWAHSISVWVTFPLGMLGGVMAQLTSGS
jgi:hypothetical protein